MQMIYNISKGLGIYHLSSLLTTPPSIINNVQCTLLAVADHISEMNICSWALWAEQESQGKFGQSSGNWPLLEMQPATQHRGPVLPQLHICTGILANLI